MSKHKELLESALLDGAKTLSFPSKKEAWKARARLYKARQRLGVRYAPLHFSIVSNQLIIYRGPL